MKKIFNHKVWGKLMLLAGAFSLTMLASCGDDVIGQTPTDGDAPGQVSNVQVTNIPSGAQITYDLPKDEDLLYVEARYMANGKERNVKASCFENKLTIEGYGDMDEHKVDLICVDRSKNASAPVSVNIKPLENPVHAISRSLQMSQGIGGIGLAWENTNKATVNLQIYAADSFGAMQLVEVLATQSEQGSYSLRGFDDQRRRFAVVVKDHWDNVSDTISGYFTPRFEQLIPKSDCRRYLFPEDNNTNIAGWTWDKMFDDVTGVDNNGWHIQKNGSGHGVYFTVDLGHKVQLTRYMLWQRGGDWPYRQNNPRQWEVYGLAGELNDVFAQHSENDQAYWANGFRNDATNWIHLMHCTTPKPSGFDNYDITSADKEYANAGHEYIFDENVPAVRYIRFTIDETWGGGDLFNCNELAFYGKIVDE